MAAESHSLDLDLDLNRELADMATTNVEIALRNLASARDELREIEVLLNWGEQTELDHRQAEIAVEARELEYFSALAEENAAVNDLLVLYGIGWYDE